MRDTIVTSRPVSAVDAARIARGEIDCPEMIPVEQYEREYGHKPAMSFNVSAAARALAAAVDERIADEVYARVSPPRFIK